MVTNVQMVPIFPPKNLEKIRAPKIRMRLFFYNFQSYFTFYSVTNIIYYVMSCKVVNNNKDCNQVGFYFIVFFIILITMHLKYLN